MTHTDQQLRTCIPRRSATFAPRYLSAVSLLALIAALLFVSLLSHLAARFAAGAAIPAADLLHTAAFFTVALLCSDYLRKTTLLRYDARTDTFRQRRLLSRWQPPHHAADYRAVTLQECADGWRVLLLGDTNLTVYRINNAFTANRKIARRHAERIARASALPFILHPHQDPADDTLTYRQTAAAEHARPSRRILPPGLICELALLLTLGLYLHAALPRLADLRAAWLPALLLPYALLRCICWWRQDKHRHFFPAGGQQNAAAFILAAAILAAIPLCHTLAALYRAAGGQSGHLPAILLMGSLSLIPAALLRREWRNLQKPLLSYQADNHTFVLYRWQDYRHVADKTWPTDNFRGIALRALPINRWQLLLLGKNGQADILLEEGAERPLRKRQKILARSSGMAMLET